MLRTISWDEWPTLEEVAPVQQSILATKRDDAAQIRCAASRIGRSATSLTARLLTDPCCGENVGIFRPRPAPLSPVALGTS